MQKVVSIDLVFYFFLALLLLLLHDRLDDLQECFEGLALLFWIFLNGFRQKLLVDLRQWQCRGIFTIKTHLAVKEILEVNKDLVEGMGRVLE